MLKFESGQERLIGMVPFGERPEGSEGTRFKALLGMVLRHY